MRLGWVKETPHATAEVGGLGEVGCVLFACAAECEDARERRDGAENFVCLTRSEIQSVFEMEGRCHTENCSRG